MRIPRASIFVIDSSGRNVLFVFEMILLSAAISTAGQIHGLFGSSDTSVKYFLQVYLAGIGIHRIFRAIPMTSARVIFSSRRYPPVVDCWGMIHFSARYPAVATSSFVYAKVRRLARRKNNKMKRMYFIICMFL